MTERLKRLMAGFEAVWIVKPENIRYLTGFTGEGCLLARKDAAYILTDSRYTELAGLEAPDCVCLMTTTENKTVKFIGDLLREKDLRTLGYEPDVVTVATFEEMRKGLPGVEFVSCKNASEKLREVKDEGELNHIIAAAKIACQAFAEILPTIHPGVSEREVQIALDFAMLRLGAEKVGFDTIAGSGPNGSLPHAVPGERRIQSGEFLTLDFGARVDGYLCDMTRTIAVGEPCDELKKIYETVLTAQEKALALVKPGARCADIDYAARSYIDARYPGRFGHGLGHGVGLFIHENPRFAPSSDETLVPGNVVTVEPGIYIPNFGGCRIEDMVLVTEDGYINPITAPKNLIVV